jgi:RNA polymerase sigma factor (sigma-70 family)
MITPVRPSDYRLLHRFAFEADEEAFEELVERHAGMTRAVCRRVLGPAGDADDAAQTAFASLAKNAAALAVKLGPSGSLAGWLYRVAVNAALQQRRAAKARRRREATVVREREPAEGVATEVEHADLLRVLDEELKELPASYRTPLVLCHLEGKTQHEAAEQLGLSYGTLRRRLDRGKKLLRARIGRRGAVTTSAILAALLDSVTAKAGTVPTGFAQAVTASLTVGPPVAKSPVALVRPRVASASRVPRPVSPFAGPIPATVYSLLLAALLTVMAIPPVVSLIASAGGPGSPAGGYQPSVPSYGIPNGSLNRSAV